MFNIGLNAYFLWFCERAMGYLLVGMASFWEHGLNKLIHIASRDKAVFLGKQYKFVQSEPQTIAA